MNRETLHDTYLKAKRLQDSEFLAGYEEAKRGIVLVCRPESAGELGPFSEVELIWAGRRGNLDLRADRGIVAELLAVLAAKSKYDFLRGIAADESGLILESELRNLNIKSPYQKLRDHLRELNRAGRNKYRRISEKLGLADKVHYEALLCHYPLSPATYPNRIWFLEVEPEDVWIAVRRREGAYKREALFDALGDRFENTFDAPIEEPPAHKVEREEQEKALLSKFFGGKLLSDRRRLSIIAKALQKPTEGGTESTSIRLPLQKLIKDYKKRIADNWQRLWFSHLDPRETSAPYLNRTVIPENEAARRKHPGPQNLAELITKESVIILLGDPGSGKSYTTARLAVECAEGKLLEGYFPIYTSLSLFRGAGGLSALCDEAIKKVIGPEDYPQGLYDSLCRRKIRMLMVFDALNEARAGRTRQLIDHLGSYMQGEKRKVILTCRSYEYNEEFSQTPVFSLAPLEEEQIIEYLAGFFNVAVTSVFRHKVERYYKFFGMMKDPFTLSKIAMHLSTDADGQLPPNLGQLLNSLVERLPRWKASEKSETRSLEYGLHTEKNSLLAIVAHTMVFELNDATTICREELERALASWRPSFSIEHLLRQAFCDRLLKQGGYLFPKGEIEFSHAFLKYCFAARLMKDRLASKGDAKKKARFLSALLCPTHVLTMLFNILEDQESREIMEHLIERNPYFAAQCFEGVSKKEPDQERRLIENLKRVCDACEVVGLLQEMGTDAAVDALTEMTLTFPWSLHPCFEALCRVGSQRAFGRALDTIHRVGVPEAPDWVLLLFQYGGISRDHAVRLLDEALSEVNRQRTRATGRSLIDLVKKEISIAIALCRLDRDVRIDSFSHLFEARILPHISDSLFHLAFEFGTLKEMQKAIALGWKAGFRFDEPKVTVLVRESMPPDLLRLSRGGPSRNRKWDFQFTKRILTRIVTEQYDVILKVLDSDCEANQVAAAWAVFEFSDLRNSTVRLTLTQRLNQQHCFAAKLYIAGSLARRGSGLGVPLLMDGLASKQKQYNRIVLDIVERLLYFSNDVLVSQALSEAGLNKNQIFDLYSKVIPF